MSINTYYKYRTDSEYTELILASGKVYLSTAEGLNDPFECSLQEIGKEWIEEKVKEMQQAGVASFIIEAKRAAENKSSFFGLSKEEANHVLDEIKNLKGISEISNYRAEFIKRYTGHYPADSERMFAQIDSQLLSVGIFSMSTNPAHPLMWSHYAGEHSGICLGFKKTPESRLSNSEHFLPVVYSDKLPEMARDGFNTQMNFSVDERGALYTSSFKIAFSDRTFQKAITTKPTCWNYEEEWRYIEPYPGLFNWPGPLSEITFGLRCKEERRNHFIRLTEESVPYPVHFYQMRKKHGGNELERIQFEKSLSNPRVISNPIQEIKPDREELTLQDFTAKMERLIREEKYGEVLFQVEENLKDDPNSPILLNLKGIAHGFAQEPEKALECFMKLIKEYPNVAQGWYQAACALVALKRYEEAVVFLKQANGLDSNDPSTAFNLGIVLLELQKKEEALKYFKQADRLGHRKAFGYISEIEK